MFFVTKEIEKNKELREIFKKNVNFKEIEFSENIKSAKYNSNPLIIGSAFEIYFQIERLRKERNSYGVKNLKFNRGYYLLLKAIEVVEDKFKEKIHIWLKDFKRNQQVIVSYIEKTEEISDKKLMKAILFLNFIAMFREIKNVYYLKPKYGKDEVKELINLKKSFSKQVLKEINEDSEFVYFNYVVNVGFLAGEIDILTDKCIYDMKTTSIPIFTKEMLYQLLMYYFLMKRNGVKVKKIAILFSKHSKIVEIKIKKLFKEDGESKIESFLKEEYKL